MEAAFFASMLLAVVIQGWHGNRLLGRLGAHAYGLHLTHTLMLEWTASVVAGVALLLVISALAWRWIEAPLIRVGRGRWMPCARPIPR